MQGIAPMRSKKKFTTLRSLLRVSVTSVFSSGLVVTWALERFPQVL